MAVEFKSVLKQLLKCYSPDIYNSGSNGGGITVEKGGAGCNDIIVCDDTDLALTKQSLKKNTISQY